MAGIVVVGAWFRLHDLGAAALRADTIHFWSICRMPISGWDVVTKWTELGVGQMPLPLAVTKAYIDWFGVEPTEFHLRLPNALFGIALIPVMFAIGRRFMNGWTGLVAALLVALNPFHIQLSMEAYFYASLILGAGLMVLSAFQAVDAYRDQRALPGSFPWVSGGGFLLIAYSQVTGWVLAFLLILTVVTVGWMNRSRHERGRQDFVKMLVTYGVVGAPLLVVSWGLPHILDKLKDRGQIEFGEEVVALIGDNAFTLLHRMVTSMAWGQTFPRVVLVVALLLSGVACLVGMIRRNRMLGFVPLVLVVNYGLFLMTRSAFGALYESRYLAGILPMYMVLLAGGITGAGGWLERFGMKGAGRVAPWIFLGLVVLALSGPAWAANQLRGKPVPYKDIVETVDRLLPKGVPVVVDRWYEPWNEMRVYPSTNVVFMFTVPNEPLQMFRQFQWRETTQNFFQRNPDAAYLEVAKTFHEVPDIGPWAWPHQYFARRVRIANEPGLRLRDLGVAARGDFYFANTNRVVVELFYNAREDALEKLRAGGVEVFGFFGPGWRYEMTGPFGFVEVQTQNIQHWRGMRDRAVIEVENLTGERMRVGVRLRGVAVNGSKQVIAADRYRKTFPAGTMETWEFGPVEVGPGMTEIPLRDDLYGAAGVRLLVERIEVGRVGN